MLKLATRGAGAALLFSFSKVSNIAGRFMFFAASAQIEIDVIELQLFQAGVERSADRVRCQVFVPHLGGDMQILRATRAARWRRRSPLRCHTFAVSICGSRDRARFRPPHGRHRLQRNVPSQAAAADALGLQMLMITPEGLRRAGERGIPRERAFR